MRLSVLIRTGSACAPAEQERSKRYASGNNVMYFRCLACFEPGQCSASPLQLSHVRGTERYTCARLRSSQHAGSVGGSLLAISSGSGRRMMGPLRSPEPKLPRFIRRTAWAGFAAAARQIASKLRSYAFGRSGSAAFINLVGARLAREADFTVCLIHRMLSFAGKPRSNRFCVRRDAASARRAWKSGRAAFRCRRWAAAQP